MHGHHWQLLLPAGVLFPYFLFAEHTAWHLYFPFAELYSGVPEPTDNHNIHHLVMLCSFYHHTEKFPSLLKTENMMHYHHPSHQQLQHTHCCLSIIIILGIETLIY